MSKIIFSAPIQQTTLIRNDWSCLRFSVNGKRGRWKLIEGQIPPGMKLAGSEITGYPKKVGVFRFVVETSDRKHVYRKRMIVRVESIKVLWIEHGKTSVRRHGPSPKLARIHSPDLRQ